MLGMGRQALTMRDPESIFVYIEINQRLLGACDEIQCVTLNCHRYNIQFLKHNKTTKEEDKNTTTLIDRRMYYLRTYYVCINSEYSAYILKQLSVQPQIKPEYFSTLLY